VRQMMRLYHLGSKLQGGHLSQVTPASNAASWLGLA